MISTTLKNPLLKRLICVAVLLVVVCTPLFAADITGTVTNKTANKPSVGDDVILIELKQTMQELTRTKTDAQGKYTLHFADSQDPHLVRVAHQGANYHKPAPAGTTQVDVDVYDVSENLSGVSQSLDVMRVEADSSTIHVVEMLSINNGSQPPRTLLGAKSFQIVLPEGAQVTQSLAAGPGGMPVSSAPVPTGEKNHYSIIFPMRPGETRFQLAYNLPYNGKTTIAPHLLRLTDNFAVSVPKSMQLSPASGSKLEPKGEDAGMLVFVAQNVSANANLGFTVAGTGSVPLDNNDRATDQGGDAATGAESQAKPGGGLGEPVNSPDPLYKYRWWLIAAVALILVAGAAYSMSTPAAKAGASNIQQLLKDELFQLETERLESKITPEEYVKAKSALDVLMARVAARKPE